MNEKTVNEIAQHLNREIHACIDRGLRPTCGEVVAAASTLLVKAFAVTLDEAAKAGEFTRDNGFAALTGMLAGLLRGIETAAPGLGPLALEFVSPETGRKTDRKLSVVREDPP